MLNRKTKSAPAIVWFRRNLRLTDNLALIKAAESGQPILPVYVLDELDSGPAARWWLHHSLTSLDRSLKQIDSSLLILSGIPSTLLGDLAKQIGAQSLYYCQRFEPLARQQEEDLETSLGQDIDIIPCGDAYLTTPEGILSKAGAPFKVFTPYWNAASALAECPAPRSVPENLTFVSQGSRSLSLADLELLPRNPDWASKFHDTWTPGEDAALRRLDNIDEAVENYSIDRDRPDLDSTSRLSPHLHFGEISPRQVVSALNHSGDGGEATAGASSLRRQLYWRDFSAYLLFHNPTLPQTPLRQGFDYFPWSDSRSDLTAWQQGMTGYPIVDAGMRQLWATGWMHNRVRMIVASFLVKDLLIPWQQGAAWFLRTLLDADLANNSASWQWVAGCGTDSAPFFRVFNPVLQSKKFDPNGHYVRRWVPELKNLPAKYLHEPWTAPLDTQSSCRILIGRDYPKPIVDHSVARKEALAAYQFAKDRFSAENSFLNQRNSDLETGT